MKLESRGICKAFGGVRALVDVSIDFPGSGTVAIVGPNGAGKTTLIDSLTGIVEPDRGRWLLEGDDVTGLSTEAMVRKGVARSFQGLRLIQDQSVLDNLALAVPAPEAETILASLRRAGKGRHSPQIVEKVKELAAGMGLAERLTEPVSSLSYGEQKLASVLATAATGAAIVLLDEPMAGVHGDGVDRLVGYARHLARSGRLVVFIEHDMETVRRLADVVIVLAEGRVLAVGPPAEVLLRKDLLEAYLA